MIPADLAALCDAQTGGAGRDDVLCVLEELDKLQIPRESEFAEIVTTYNLAMLSKVGNSLEQLIDPCWPMNDLASAAEFTQSAWKIPASFIPFTTLDGEGAYLYHITTGGVWTFDLAHREEFRDGRQSPMFESFFEFLNWYLADPELLKN